MSINQLPHRPLSGRRITVDPPLDNLNYQLASGTLEICHIEGNNYVYDRHRDKIIFGLEAEQELPVEGWDYPEKKYGVVYTELSPHELAVELHAIPSEGEIIADIVRHTPLMAKLFSEKELYALLHHEKNALTEEQILNRINDSLKTEDYRFLSETAAGVLSLREALSREALAKQLGIEALTPEHATEFAARAHARQTQKTQNKMRLEALATDAEKNLHMKWHKKPENPDRAICVAQHEFQMTDGGILGTTNLLQCIAFIVHDPKTKRAALAHIDKLTDMKSINTIFDVVDAGNPLDVYLVGSKQASHHTAGRLIEQTQRHATESNRAVTLRGLDFNGSTYMCFNAATAAITPTRPDASQDTHQRFARATDDPRHISPLMPHNINGLTIDNFAGDTDAFHLHLHNNRHAVAPPQGEDTRLQPGATSTTLGTVPTHRLPAHMRETLRKADESGQGIGG